MRPQQNRRMRGRGNNNNNNSSNNGNNNNRKGPNPLTRSYESNGPDVKIRGTAQQIAEKYTTLARDAQSSGDRVMAENYLQHAEHYNRIIFTALAQQAATQQQRDTRDDDDEDGDDNDAGFDGNNNNHSQRGDQNQQPRGDRQNRDNRDRDNRGNRENRDEQAAADGSGPQPVIDGVPAEVALNQEDAAAGEGRRQRAPRRERAPRAEQGAGEGEVAAVSSPAQLAASVQSAEAAGDDTGERKPRRTRRPRLKADEGESAGPADEKSDDVGEAAA